MSTSDTYDNDVAEDYEDEPQDFEGEEEFGDALEDEYAELDMDQDDAGLYPDDDDGAYMTMDYDMLDDMFSTGPPIPIATPPPIPRNLANPGDFTENNLEWRRAGFDNRYDLIDTRTGRLALFSARMRLWSDNFDITRGITNQSRGGLAKEKIFCIGKPPEIPGVDSDAYWNTVVAQIQHLLDAFAVQHPGAANRAPPNPASFLQVENYNSIKVQQPFLADDSWMYGLNMDPFYAHFLQNIPADLTYINIPMPDNQPPSRLYINPLPAYNEQGDIIGHQDYEQELSNANVEMEFSMHHVDPQGATFRAFISRPHAIQVIGQDELRAGPSNAVRVKREVKREEEAGSSDPNGKGKARMVDEEDGGDEGSVKQESQDQPIKEEEDDSASKGKGKARAVDQ